MSSHTPTTQYTATRNGTVRPIPPTFITIAEIKDCDPHGIFPQAYPLPHYPQATQIQFSCEFYEKDYVAWTMYIFYELWEKEFGDPEGKIRDALDHLEIQWGKDRREVHNVYDIDGNFFETSDVSGLMENSYTIWVWVEDNISETSFVHELTHVSLFHLCGNADADHEGDKFVCWSEEHSLFIDDVNAKLKSIYGI